MRLHRVCELCGQPAIAIVIDLIIVPSPGPYWPVEKPHSAHIFCAAHDRASIYYLDDTAAHDPDLLTHVLPYYPSLVTAPSGPAPATPPDLAAYWPTLDDLPDGDDPFPDLPITGSPPDPCSNP